jgi:hypothetical protein
VSADHLVRQIDAMLDLSWVYKELAPYYSQTAGLRLIRFSLIDMQAELPKRSRSHYDSLTVLHSVKLKPRPFRKPGLFFESRESSGVRWLALLWPHLGAGTPLRADRKHVAKRSASGSSKRTHRIDMRDDGENIVEHEQPCAGAQPSDSPYEAASTRRTQS